MRALVLACVALVGLSAPVRAQPAAPPSDVLRGGNVAASQGDWARVADLVTPLFVYQLVPADLAEAHRLAGLAAFFQQHPADAEAHFLAYLKIDLEGRLDPALYPPEVVGFFDDVRVRHVAELRRLRPQLRRHFVFNLLPPLGQYQNGDRGKMWVLGGALFALAVANVTTYLVLRSWCDQATGTCDDNKDHVHAAGQVRGVNIATGIGLILTYVYGVYDGIHTYHRKSSEQVQPFVSSSEREVFAGVTGRF